MYFQDNAEPITIPTAGLMDLEEEEEEEHAHADNEVEPTLDVEPESSEGKDEVEEQGDVSSSPAAAEVSKSLMRGIGTHPLTPSNPSPISAFTYTLSFVIILISNITGLSAG